MQLELTHDVSAMRFRGFYADAESHGHFLAALPFREELNDFAFPGSEPATQDSHVVGHRVLFAEPVKKHVRSIMLKLQQAKPSARTSSVLRPKVS